MAESESDHLPHIMLGMPGYGEVTSGASRAFWRATRLPDSHVRYQYNEGSLLAANFNSLWTAALNAVQCGERVDYFAMIHADIEPRDYWLDDLIAELESHQLDILGVVAPIKDHRGLTSIALDRSDKDTWRPLCRLTMREVFQLPETFTSTDVGHNLLLNTGLWVCKFDPAWASKVYFTINDRIVQTPSGAYAAQCEPEDWFFSRLCHEQDLKIGATRKIPLRHRGPSHFANTGPWGQPFDSDWSHRSQLPEVWNDGFEFPSDIPGWLTRDEGKALAELARDKTVLEIGSYCGLSTVCLARTAQSVTSIDPHDGRGTPHPADTLSLFRANLARYRVDHKVSLEVGTLSPDEIDSPPCYDLVFIDGSHDLASVQNNIECALKLVKPDGLILFHDYNNGADPDVKVAVDAFCSTGAELIRTVDSVAVVKPPANLSLEVYSHA